MENEISLQNVYKGGVPQTPQTRTQIKEKHTPVELPGVSVSKLCKNF